MPHGNSLYTTTLSSSGFVTDPAELQEKPSQLADLG